MGGTQPSVITDKDGLRANAGAQSGDATIVEHGLSFGKMVHGGDVGKMKAQYAKVAGVAGVTTYRVPHTLGIVPGFCMLVASDNPSTPATVLSASPEAYDKWTATECRVRVFANIGNIAGSAMWFMIGGER
jgi:hypothetical protein